MTLENCNIIKHRAPSNSKPSEKLPQQKDIHLPKESSDSHTTMVCSEAGVNPNEDTSHHMQPTFAPEGDLPSQVPNSSTPVKQDAPRLVSERTLVSRGPDENIQSSGYSNIKMPTPSFTPSSLISHKLPCHKPGSSNSVLVGTIMQAPASPDMILKS